MPDEWYSVEAVFSQMAIFKALDAAQLENLAHDVELLQLEEGEVLFKEGEPGHNFFVLIGGRVTVSRGIGKARHVLAELIPGDFIGEEAMVVGRPRSATITAAEKSIIARFSRQQFESLLKTYPDIRMILRNTIETRRLVRNTGYGWLDKEETIYLMARKHIAYLFVTLLPPFVLAWVSVPILYFSMFQEYEAFSSLALWVGLLLLLAAVAWGIWRAVDWGNDYYIVTSQRVVWLEKVVLLYESRQEAPLGTILTVGFVRDYLGRLLGYGDVIVSTYTGQIAMRHLGMPQSVVSMIEEQRYRYRNLTKREETEALEKTIRERLERDTLKKPLSTRLPPVVAGPQKKAKVNPLRHYLNDFFKTQIEENGVITFRKHWILLLRKIWLPTLLLAVLAYLFFARLAGAYDFFSVGAVSLVTLSSLLGVFLWWLYQYLDWANDVYQVTYDQILDIYRTPLGREDKKVAQLENILSLHHVRKGIIGLLLNFGDVVAMVGAVEFTFDGVYNPAGVQQEIFLRMNLRKQKAAEANARAERERIADWLAAYDRQKRNMGDYENPPHFGPNSG